MAHHVGEGFLDHTESGEFEPWRERPPLAHHLDGDIDAGFGHMSSQLIEVVEFRLGFEVGLTIVVAQYAEHAPHLVHRVPSDRLDRAQRLTGPFGFRIEHALCCL